MALNGRRTNIEIGSLRQVIPDSKIVEYYFGVTEFPATIKSTFRGDDERPSLRLFMGEDNIVRFYDLGTGDSGDCIELVMITFNINFSDAVNKIYYDIVSDDDFSFSYKVSPKKAEKAVDDTKIDVKIRPFRDHDVKFWGKYNLNEEWLRFGNIYPISHVFFDKNGIKTVIDAERHAYVYVEFKDGHPTYKIYQPFSERIKWLSKHDKSIWDLWDRLPERGETLIITSSRKDALCIWANLGIPSTSLQSEAYIPKENVINELKARFRNIYVLYDNDNKPGKINTGRVNGFEFAKAFNLTQIEIPDKYESKDPSDLLVNHGLETFLNVMRKLLK